MRELSQQTLNADTARIRHFFLDVFLGCRKAADPRLAEARCSASEIVAITGHRALAKIEGYMRAAEQERLVRQAIKRQFERKSGKRVREEVAKIKTKLKLLA
jgi:hypothetical protein